MCTNLKFILVIHYTFLVELQAVTSLAVEQVVLIINYAKYMQFG